MVVAPADALGTPLLPAMAWSLTRPRAGEEVRPRLVQPADVLYGGIAALVSDLVPAGITVVSPSTASVLCSGDGQPPRPRLARGETSGAKVQAPQARGLRRRTAVSRCRPA
ncbi:hypothetical protein ABZ260_25595 [Streptosporangium sp. NPDC006013]|uniref:hypothetical protein n=1 Tax=Streptosporangium sp. NPDC006013 TaxID=3155596 RepID=UPI0033B19969